MRRRTQFLTVLYGVTGLAHGSVALALGAVLPPGLALGVAAALFGVTAVRLRSLAHDRKRPRWVTRLVDEPVLWHWGGTLLSLPCALFALPVAHGLEVGAAWAFATSYAAGLAFSGWGIWGLRHWVQIRRVELGLPGLHADLDGYRIAQLSDLHIGSFDPKSRGLDWARKANALEPDLCVVTGDLVTSGTSFYDDVADVIGALSAKDGVLCTLGNHDQWDDKRLARAIEDRGARVLRNEWTLLCRGSGRLVVAGVDDPYSRQDDLDQTLADRPAGVPTVLLAHYPHFFVPAAERGVELVLSGHTHGGQIGLPLLGDRLNIATLLGQRSRGLYRRGQSALYVNAGLGTTGPPIRLGIRPEITLLVRRREAPVATGR
jgi:uncharacterized protein